MKEMTPLSIIENNENLRWLEKETRTFPGQSCVYKKNFTTAGKLQEKNDLQSLACVESPGGATCFYKPFSGKNRKEDQVADNIHGSAALETGMPDAATLLSVAALALCAKHVYAYILHWACGTIGRRGIDYYKFSLTWHLVIHVAVMCINA